MAAKHALHSIFKSKCPKCNLGDLYVDNNMYHLRSLGKMKVKCEYCGQLFEPETGFYYGAMYVSYAVSIAAMFVPAYTLYFLFNVGFPVMLSVVIGIYILFFPVFFRLSRNIWLNIFVKFSQTARDKALKGK